MHIILLLTISLLLHDTKLTFIYFQYVKNQYQTCRGEESQRIYFVDDKITLDVPDTPTVVVDDWSIVPLSYPEVNHV